MFPPDALGLDIGISVGTFGAGVMRDVNTVELYREREQRERTLAAMAISPGVAAMHRDLADHYRELILEATQSHRLTPSMPAAS